MSTESTTISRSETPAPMRVVILQAETQSLHERENESSSLKRATTCSIDDVGESAADVCGGHGAGIDESRETGREDAAFDNINAVNIDQQHQYMEEPAKTAFSTDLMKLNDSTRVGYPQLTLDGVEKTAAAGAFSAHRASNPFPVQIDEELKETLTIASSHEESPEEVTSTENRKEFCASPVDGLMFADNGADQQCSDTTKTDSISGNSPELMDEAGFDTRLDIHSTPTTEGPPMNGSVSSEKRTPDEKNGDGSRSQRQSRSRTPQRERKRLALDELIHSTGVLPPPPRRGKNEDATNKSGGSGSSDSPPSGLQSGEERKGPLRRGGTESNNWRKRSTSPRPLRSNRNQQERGQQERDRDVLPYPSGKGSRHREREHSEREMAPAWSLKGTKGSRYGKGMGYRGKEFWCEKGGRGGDYFLGFNYGSSGYEWRDHQRRMLMNGKDSRESANLLSGLMKGKSHLVETASSTGRSRHHTMDHRERGGRFSDPMAILLNQSPSELREAERLAGLLPQTAMDSRPPAGAENRESRRDQRPGREGWMHDCVAEICTLLDGDQRMIIAEQDAASCGTTTSRAASSSSNGSTGASRDATGASASPYSEADWHKWLEGWTAAPNDRPSAHLQGPAHDLQQRNGGSTDGSRAMGVRDVFAMAKISEHATAPGGIISTTGPDKRKGASMTGASARMSSSSSAAVAFPGSVLDSSTTPSGGLDDLWRSLESWTSGTSPSSSLQAKPSSQAERNCRSIEDPLSAVLGGSVVRTASYIGGGGGVVAVSGNGGVVNTSGTAGAHQLATASALAPSSATRLGQGRSPFDASLLPSLKSHKTSDHTSATGGGNAGNTFNLGSIGALLSSTTPAALANGEVAHGGLITAPPGISAGGLAQVLQPSGASAPLVAGLAQAGASDPRSSEDQAWQQYMEIVTGTAAAGI
ncbi:unnamed protein product [Amoebophrya sp. A25]|nr:unnamed protein product [Amoebophrya sp. A25]|eukprot:GSA25T00002290001.1